MDFANDFHIHGEGFTDENINLKYTGAISGNPTSYKFNPKNKMVRFEYLEVIVRLAKEKYKDLTLDAAV